MSPNQSSALLPPEPLLSDKKRELVDQVASSQTFQRSPRLREFLLYVADCTLSGRLDDAREQQIAQQVFHRKPDYDPDRDNIVRVEARMLRKRLETYFAEEGRDATVIITMPKGSYSLKFEIRDTATVKALAESRPPSGPESAGPIEPALCELPGIHAGVAKKSSGLHRARTWLISATACLFLTSIVLYVLSYKQSAAANPVPPQTLPLSAVINGQRDTYVITSDTSLIMIQDLTHQRISLNDYINRRYPGLPSGSTTPELFTSLPYRDYTDAVETSAASKILLQNGRAAQRMFLRSARQVELPELKEQNVILLGSPESNPWGNLYYENLPFQFEESRRGSIRNEQPHVGESKEYFTPTRSGDTGYAYAILAFVPNIGVHGSALLIGGTTAEATAAAGEFVLDQTQISAALRKMGIEPTGPPQYFELLLKAKTFPGSATQSTIEAWRRLQPANTTPQKAT
jgi:hypothetical protein